MTTASAHPGTAYPIARTAGMTALFPALFAAALLLNLAVPARVSAAAEEYTAKAGAPSAEIQVDASQAPRGIMSAHLTLPVTAGPLTLVYPKWLPGRHSPAGPLTSLGGPIFKVNGQILPWRRDSVDLNAFHLEIPAGATQLGVDLEIDTTLAPDGVVQGLETPRTATESLLILEWNQLVLYPAETRSDDLSYQASLRLPAGWKYASALETRSAGVDGIRFAPVSLTTLVDSTLLAGRYLRDIPLGGNPAVTLHIAADTPVALNMSKSTEAHYRRLVREAAALFGATHYDHYEFLYALTDQIMPDGLEHHQSSDDRSPLRALLDDPIRRAEANLLPHEYVHSWNGKYRRPAGLATANYQDPMLGDMLWVYEGLTEYLGDVLAARSGLYTDEEFRGELAHDAAAMQSHSAREWRSLQETTVSASSLAGGGHAHPPPVQGAQEPGRFLPTVLRTAEQRTAAETLRIRRRGKRARGGTALRLGRFLEGAAEPPAARGSARRAPGRRVAADICVRPHRDARRARGGRQGSRPALLARVLRG